MKADAPPSGSGGPASVSRAEAVALERERLRALGARRETDTANAAVDAFTVRKWRKVGIFCAHAVEQALARLRQLAEQDDPATPGWAFDAFCSAQEGNLEGDLLPAVWCVPGLLTCNA